MYTIFNNLFSENKCNIQRPGNYYRYLHKHICGPPSTDALSCFYSILEETDYNMNFVSVQFPSLL